VKPGGYYPDKGKWEQHKKEELAEAGVKNSSLQGPIAGSAGNRRKAGQQKEQQKGSETQNFIHTCFHRVGSGVYD
jgi:hypothetical protein